jgi:hypothetical protein
MPRIDTRSTTTEPWRRLLRVSGLTFLAVVCLLAVAKPAFANCTAIRSEAQLEHVNRLVEEGVVEELDQWGQYSIRLKQVSRHGTATKLRLVHAKQGESHLAFEHHCPAVLQVTTAKREESCEPNPVKERVTCAKRWFVTGTKERWLKIDKPISLHIASGPGRIVSVDVAMDPWFIPGQYALNVVSQTPTLKYGGG